MATAPSRSGKGRDRPRVTVALTAESLMSGDRGWDAGGEPVCGTVTEGRIFDRLP
ncbi:MAG: hypothetical protein JW819_10935 [Candidatus Krumholzibacteriota bacterium]|nr:hypothetical protein [Candidatus Krumholzibacteriota bacterium]